MVRGCSSSNARPNEIVNYEILVVREERGVNYPASEYSQASHSKTKSFGSANNSEHRTRGKPFSINDTSLSPSCLTDS